jgi:hypothetical protein
LVTVSAAETPAEAAVGAVGETQVAEVRVAETEEEEETDFPSLSPFPAGGGLG